MVRHLKIPCWECGTTVAAYATDDESMTRIWCEQCDKKRQEEKKKLDNYYVYITRVRMIETAIKTLEKQRLDPYEYREAIGTVSKAVMTGRSKFDSSHEMALAIELISNHVNVKTQYDVAGYKFDLCLPDFQVLVEVDGDRHKMSKQKDALRDVVVHERLGGKWEVVRVKTERVESGLRDILSWILAQQSKQQEYRAKNDGMVPWTYNGNEYTEIYRLGKKLKPLKENTPNNPV